MKFYSLFLVLLIIPSTHAMKQTVIPIANATATSHQNNMKNITTDKPIEEKKDNITIRSPETSRKKKNNCCTLCIPLCTIAATVWMMIYKTLFTC